MDEVIPMLSVVNLKLNIVTSLNIFCMGPRLCFNAACTACWFIHSPESDSCSVAISRFFFCVFFFFGGVVVGGGWGCWWGVWV